MVCCFLHHFHRLWNKMCLWIVLIKSKLRVRCVFNSISRQLLFFLIYDKNKFPRKLSHIFVTWVYIMSDGYHYKLTPLDMVYFWLKIISDKLYVFDKKASSIAIRYELILLVATVIILYRKRTILYLGLEMMIMTYHFQ